MRQLIKLFADQRTLITVPRRVVFSQFAGQMGQNFLPESVDELTFQESSCASPNLPHARGRRIEWPKSRLASSIHIERSQVRKQRKPILFVNQLNECFERARFVTQCRFPVCMTVGTAQIHNLRPKTVALRSIATTHPTASRLTKQSLWLALDLTRRHKQQKAPETAAFR